jgi:hypothetical protein
VLPRVPTRKVRSPRFLLFVAANEEVAMPERRVNRSHTTVLWRLRGATDDLRGLAIETSFGYALGLELDAELVLLHLQPNFECLIGYAHRLESALIKQGWHAVKEPIAARRCHASVM